MSSSPPDYLSKVRVLRTSSRLARKIKIQLLRFPIPDSRFTIHDSRFSRCGAPLSLQVKRTTQPPTANPTTSHQLYASRRHTKLRVALRELQSHTAAYTRLLVQPVATVPQSTTILLLIITLARLLAVRPVSAFAYCALLCMI